MAVEIVPRPKAKPKRLISILFYVSLILLILTVAAYFGLYSIKDKKDKELEELRSVLATQETDELREIRKELEEYQGKVGDLSVLLDSYHQPTKAIKFIGSITHPKVMWNSFTLGLVDGRVALSGQTESITTLLQQVYILEGESRISEFRLDSFSLVDKGGVSLGVSFILNPELF